MFSEFLKNIVETLLIFLAVTGIVLWEQIGFYKRISRVYPKT